jgi:cytochrome c-type biogenesis protein CcmH/NrfG
MVGDFEASLRDIQQTLALEPRHFGALGGLSMILENTMQYDKAIQAEKLLLKLMPENGLIKERIQNLQTRELESRI